LENLLIVGKFLSISAKAGTEKFLFGGNLGADLKFWSPCQTFAAVRWISAGISQCLSENRSFLFRLVFLTRDAAAYKSLFITMAAVKYVG